MHGECAEFEGNLEPVAWRLDTELFPTRGNEPRLVSPTSDTSKQGLPQNYSRGRPGFLLPRTLPSRPARPPAEDEADERHAVQDTREWQCGREAS